MIDRARARRTLSRLFSRKPIASLDELQHALCTHSRVTVYRILRAEGYVTSYSHAGRYYTLKDIPEFDHDGLWACGGVFFSRFGTLRATLVQLVEISEAGRTHDELREKVHLRVHDTLRDLIDDGEISRAELEGLYLYLHRERERGKAQLRERRRLLETGAPVAPFPEPCVVVDILLAVIQSPGKDPHSVTSFLAQQGKRISQFQVDAVLSRYGLGKKNSRSRRWRR